MKTTVTFDGAPPAGTINLGIGQPSADLLPVGLVAEASAAFFAAAQPNELNYGVMQGDERFLEALADFLTAGYGAGVSPENLFLTGGNSQALDFVSTVFASHGDTVFVEEPSYFLAFQVFRDHGLNIVGIPVDNDGIDMQALRHALTEHDPAFIYTIPTYHNPGGFSMSLARRKELIELSKAHDFLIIADEVYQLLSYFDEPPPPFGCMLQSDTVLSLGSFSKILAPGMRLGWIQTSPGLRDRLLENGFINSGGSINHISSHIVRLAMQLGLQDAHVRKLRDAYRSRVEAMDESLQSLFGGLADWARPHGGYFFWLKFAESVDTTLLREEARKREAGFQPGSVFSSEGRLRNYLRLSFAHYAEDDIREGLQRIRPLFDQP